MNLIEQDIEEFLRFKILKHFDDIIELSFDEKKYDVFVFKFDIKSHHINKSYQEISEEVLKISKFCSDIGVILLVMNGGYEIYISETNPHFVRHTNLKKLIL